MDPFSTRLEPRLEESGGPGSPSRPAHLYRLPESALRPSPHLAEVVPCQTYSDYGGGCSPHTITPLFLGQWWT